MPRDIGRTVVACLVALSSLQPWATMASASSPDISAEFASSHELTATATAPLLLPFAEGETWYVCQGYNGRISHQGAKALDLTVRAEDVGATGCWAADGNVNSSAGRELRAAASGTLAHVGTDLACLSFDAGGSMLIGHIAGRAGAGQVNQDTRIGYVASAATANGGYSHIHIQAHTGPGCAASGETVAFSDEHGMRFDGAPNLSSSGTVNQHRGQALSRRASPPPQIAWDPAQSFFVTVPSYWVFELSGSSGHRLLAVDGDRDHPVVDSNGGCGLRGSRWL